MSTTIEALLPIDDVVMPSDLRSASNGRLRDSVMRSERFPGWPGTLGAHHLAMRSFRALAAGAADATGLRLTVSSPTDAYRDFDHQHDLFHRRYKEVSKQQFDAAAKADHRRRSNGRFFILKDRSLAAAASPGNSNHGWGLAFDVAVFNGKVRELRPSAAWPWVRNNAQRFGFSWELQSEPWHLRLVTGDDVPKAVLAHERHDPPPTKDRDDQASPSGEPKPGPTLIVDAPPSQPFDLHVGVADAPRVRWLQAILAQRGFGRVAVSGTFEATTREAVAAMQRRLGVDDDGRYGKDTALALAHFLRQS